MTMWGNARGERVPVLTEEDYAAVRNLGREVVVEEWRVTGDPGPGYPRPYVFVWSSARFDDPEGDARRFAATASETQGGRERPSMTHVVVDHRTVAYGAWSPADSTVSPVDTTDLP